MILEVSLIWEGQVFLFFFQWDEIKSPQISLWKSIQFIIMLHERMIKHTVLSLMIKVQFESFVNMLAGVGFEHER